MESRTITLGGHDVSVSYTDAGAGDAVLLLHGGGGSMTVAGFGDR
jgi:pimeloyl-ACP methyl ester carboxylesterase